MAVERRWLPKEPKLGYYEVKCPVEIWAIEELQRQIIGTMKQNKLSSHAWNMFDTIISYE